MMSDLTDGTEEVLNKFTVVMLERNLQPADLLAALETRLLLSPDSAPYHVHSLELRRKMNAMMLDNIAVQSSQS